jgi:hypothetical protein
MITIHFSANFSDINFSFHGQKTFENANESMITSSIDTIVKTMKNELKKKCDSWCIPTANCTSFDVYYYNSTLEVTLFTWKKNEETT